jgi:hypothetical protein
MSILHVIRLEQDHFFIGNPNKAMIQFQTDPTSESTKWFATYKPVRIEEIIQKEDLYHVTLEYKAMYGDDKVHCELQDNRDNQEKINKKRTYTEHNMQHMQDMKGLGSLETVVAMRNMISKKEVKMDV